MAKIAIHQLTQRMQLKTYKNYLATIKSSVGAKLWQHQYAIPGPGKKSTDIVKGGRLSCALFASSILYLFKLIQSPHTTVSGTEKDLLASGWSRIKSPRPGAVIIWEPNFSHEQSTPHAHIGFAISQKIAISNSTIKRVPKRHSLHFGKQKRKITAIYWHPALDKNGKN